MERWTDVPGEGRERKEVVRFRFSVWMNVRVGKGRETENSVRELRWFMALIWDLRSGRRGRKRKRPRKWR